jgi:hypothetical protein
LFARRFSKLLEYAGRAKTVIRDAGATDDALCNQIKRPLQLLPVRKYVPVDGENLLANGRIFKKRRKAWSIF